MNNTTDRKSRYMRAITIILSVVLLFSVALLAISIWERSQGSYSGEGTKESDIVEYNGEEYAPRKDIETVLILGLDKFEADIDNSSYDNSQVADFLVLMVIDKANSSWSAIHINRDTIAEVNILSVSGETIGTEEKQIALAHTEGNGKEVSCRNVADAVSKLLGGIKIDRYISVTMDTVPLYNDMVGGVELEILDDFTDVDPEMVKGETVTLMGEQALTYVRTRYNMDDSSNLHRMERQKQYLNALYKKTLGCIDSEEDFIVKSTTKMFGYMVTNCTLNKLQSLTETVSDYTFEKLYDIEGESVLGEKFMEFHPDKDSVKQLVMDVFYEKQ